MNSQTVQRSQPRSRNALLRIGSAKSVLTELQVEYARLSAAADNPDHDVQVYLDNILGEEIRILERYLKRKREYARMKKICPDARKVNVTRLNDEALWEVEVNARMLYELCAEERRNRYNHRDHMETIARDNNNDNDDSDENDNGGSDKYDNDGSDDNDNDDSNDNDNEEVKPWWKIW
jgi:hypothetical protein